MYKNLALTLALVGSVSLIGAPKKQLSQEEKVEKRFDTIANQHNDLIEATKSNVELLQEYIEKIINSERKKTLGEAAQEKIENLLVDVITKIKHAQEAYLVKMATVYKKLNSPKVTKAEMQSMSTLYSKHLSLFCDEIMFLIKLLIPLKDMDTMTEEEITTALTV